MHSCCHQLAAQAVGDEQRRPFDQARILLEHLVQAGHPVAAPRPFPVVLFDTRVAMAALPLALPMVGIGIQPTRKQVDRTRQKGIVEVIRGKGVL